MILWPVEHFCSPFFFPDQHWSEIHLYRVTCYKIHILTGQADSAKKAG